MSLCSAFIYYALSKSALISITEGLCERGRKRNAFSLAPFNCFRMPVLQIQTFSQYMFRIIHINDTGIHNAVSLQPSLQKLVYSPNEKIHILNSERGRASGEKQTRTQSFMQQGKDGKGQNKFSSGS